MSRRNSTEIVHEGWLTKSPPIKRIWRARWRRRWFVLRQTGELPGQYFLEYYTDRQCLKLKGRVDLDQCEQVDAGLQFENRKLKYLKHLFDLKTPKRTYYLSAETEAEMNKWVDCVCQVCGLKADNHEEDYYDYGPPVEEQDTVGSCTLSSSVEQSSPGTGDESTPATPSSTPYIFISECYSGKPPPGVLSRHLEQEVRQMSLPWRSEKPTKLTQQNITSDEFYDMPRKLRPHPPDLELRPDQRSATPPPQSPGGDSVFSEVEWSQVPSVNWNTFPRDSVASEVELRTAKTSESSDGPPVTDLGAWSVARRFSKVCISENKSEPQVRKTSVDEDKFNPPPRPPKPSYMADGPNHSYLNIASVLGPSSNIYDNNKAVSPSVKKTHRDSVNATTSDSCPSPSSIAPTSDDMYDFPRSHQQPGEELHGPRHCYSNAAPGQATNGTIFRYDFAVDNPGQIESDPGLEPSTPKSDTGSHSSAAYSNLPSPALRLSGVPGEAGRVVAPPSVNRELKPGRKLSDSTSNEPSPSPLHPGQPAPCVDRALKPYRKVPDSPKPDQGILTLQAPPGFRSGSEPRVRRKTRAAPSPTPPGSTSLGSNMSGVGGGMMAGYSSSDDEHMFRDSADEEQNFFYLEDDKFIPASKKRLHKVKYLDLDHETMSAPSPKVKPPPAVERSTIYNTVDFIKTEAFNLTRQKVELERQHPTSTHKAQSANAVPS